MSDEQETTDVLGAPYTARTLSLLPDDEGEVVATLVTRRAETPTRKAVLHVHGFADYFFQTGAADWWVGRGYDFYALDLRKYGRSWLPHQTPTYVADLTTYYEELDAAHAIIAGDHDRIVLSAHSTGGLTVPLWLNDHQPAGVTGVALNSPWLEMASSLLMRTLGTQVIDRVGALQPKRVIPRDVSGLYARSLHRDHEGEWDFDLAWKPLESFAVHMGWLRGVRRAHARIHRGIDVGAPVLVLSSARSGREKLLGDEAMSTDIVLDVEQIRRWAPSLGRHVTIAQVEGAMHDVTLSRQPARDRVFDELGRWLTAYVER
jgi:alpha-beta hydrolase superfamily lysophospholipase